jgi:hypothetical protein
VPLWRRAKKKRKKRKKRKKMKKKMILWSTCGFQTAILKQQNIRMVLVSKGGLWLRETV